MVIEGKVFKYGDNVDTDVIIPARYLNNINLENLKLHCMEDLDSAFSRRVQIGDIMIAGENFGCGSSREHAPMAIKASGIQLVVAKSFSRIFYRNAINIGLAILECPLAIDNITQGDILKCDLNEGKIQNLNTGKIFNALPFPTFIQNIISSGGLLNSIK